MTDADAALLLVVAAVLWVALYRRRHDVRGE